MNVAQFMTNVLLISLIIVGLFFGYLFNKLELSQQRCANLACTSSFGLGLFIWLVFGPTTLSFTVGAMAFCTLLGGICAGYAFTYRRRPAKLPEAIVTDPKVTRPGQIVDLRV